MTYGKPEDELMKRPAVGVETVVEGEESKLAELNTVDVVSASPEQGGEVAVPTGEHRVAVEKDTTAREPGSEATAQEQEARGDTPATEVQPDAAEPTVDSNAVIEEDKVEQTAVEDTRTEEERAADSSEQNQA